MSHVASRASVCYCRLSSPDCTTSLHVPRGFVRVELGTNSRQLDWVREESYGQKSVAPQHRKWSGKRWLVRAMAKKKAKSAGGSDSGGSEKPADADKKAPPPQRIVPGSGLPLRYQLRAVKMYQDYAAKRAAPAAPRTPTSYRKKKEEGELTPEERKLRRLNTSLYGTAQAYHIKPPVMLVDGYNIIGAWPRLKKYFVQGDLDVARERLIHDLSGYAGFRGFKLTVVFDSVGSGLRTHEEGEHGILIVYASETADLWIEKEVARLQAEGNPKVWVATDDHLQQNMASSLDAYVWSSKILIQEIKAARKEMMEALQEERPFSVQGRLLGDGLSQDLQRELKDFKMQLKVGPPSAYRGQSSDSDSDHS